MFFATNIDERTMRMMKYAEKQEQQEEIKFWTEMEKPLDDSPKVIVTRHAGTRIKERIGCKKTVEKLAEKAFKFGISEQDASGQLKRYIRRKFEKKYTANNIRIYNQHVFLFANNILITVFKLPNRLLKTEKRIKIRQMQTAS